MAAPLPSLASELSPQGGRKASPSFSSLLMAPAPLLPIRSASGAILGSVSSGELSPLLEAVLRSYVSRLETEARASELARERASRGEPPLPSSSVWLLSDRH
jgi:hypothetical protein